MKECKEDLGEDYIPFISMIDFDSEHQPLPRLPVLQPETTLPLNALRTTADIMADILVRKQQGQLRPGHHHHILKEMQEKEERKHQEGE